MTSETHPNLHPNRYDTLIVGAGICGLTAAYRLKKTGLSVLVIEADSHPGGVIQSLALEQEALSVLVETGPNTFQGSAQSLLNLATEIGLTPKPTTALAKKRFIYHQQSLQAVPTNPVALAQSQLLTSGEKWRLLNEWSTPKRTELSDEPSDESVADFTRRHFGESVLNNLMAPFLSGVYAGDPEKLSIQAVFPRLAKLETENSSAQNGSIFQTLFQKAFGGNQKKNQSKPAKSPYKKHNLYSFEGGMADLPKALAKHIGSDNIRYNLPVTQIKKTVNGFEVFTEKDTYTCKQLILATPAYTASTLLEDISAETTNLLKQIEYAPIAVVHLALPKPALKHPLDGFGFLVPKAENLFILGSIWGSSLFDNRITHSNHALMSCFIGGSLYPERVSLNETDLVQQTLEALKQVFKTETLTPAFSKIIRWERAIPQYTLGYLARMEQILTTLNSEESGLYLTGNYKKGVSLNDSIADAETVAQTLLSRFIPE